MAKATKPKTERTKRGKYEEPLKVKGSFSDIMKAAGQHAAKKNADKRGKKA